MIRNKLGSLMLVLTMATALVPQVVTAADVPFVCADETIPQSCLLRHLPAQARRLPHDPAIAAANDEAWQAYRAGERNIALPSVAGPVGVSTEQRQASESATRFDAAANDEAWQAYRAGERNIAKASHSAVQKGLSLSDLAIPAYDGATRDNVLSLSDLPIPAYDGAPRDTATRAVICANQSAMAQRICKDDFIVP